MRRRLGCLVGGIFVALWFVGPVLAFGVFLFAQDELAAAAPQVTLESGWRIEAFDVRLVVAPDGTVEVVESITVNFEQVERRGIFRVIPVRYDLAADSDVELPDPDLEPSDYRRAIEIDGIRVHSETAPDAVDITGPSAVTDAAEVSIRIGDPDTFIAGRHTYRIGYRVRGALNGFERGPEGARHTELYWNATGNGWGVPIDRATATIEGPMLRRVGCFQGPLGSERLCDDASLAPDGTARLTAQGLQPGAGLTVVGAFDPSAVAAPPPILVERFSLIRRFVGSDWTLPLTVLASILGFGGVGWLAFRQGRDRVTRGGIAVDGTVDEELRRGLFTPRTVPVQYRPPDDLRPAQLGLLVDERVDPVDVTATVVDLAVRGHLRIVEEESKVVFWTRTDYRFVRRDDAPDESLLGYEQQLLDGLFADGDSVLLSDLKGSFHPTYGEVKRAIHEDGRRRRWFNRSPERTRGRWLAIGIGAVLASVALLVVLVLFTRWALAGIPLVLAALVLAVAHRWMPHRTSRGSDLLVRTLGFKEFIVTAESGRMDFAEQENLFVEYLPYAVVFGATDKWAQAFAHLGVAATAATTGWYVSHRGLGNLDRLSSGLSDFASKVGTGLSTTPASSGGSGFSGGGGGFSGGGMGGGGGGSW